MQRLAVDGMYFTFPDNLVVVKYDDSLFYRRHFTRVRDGVKAVDLLITSQERTAYFLEVKDYRSHPRTKPSEVCDEVAEKVIHTLAAMLPAKINASEPEERSMAQRVLSATKLRIILHLEQPEKHSKLFRRAIDPADICQKLRQKVKSIDPHPFVSERSRMGSLSWRVS